MKKKEFFKLTPFKMQVVQSFPFIDADFDALTNYELLCKVVDYLNKTVDNVNLLESDFKTLYDYVHDYFDDLDVQEEINNKLDDMAESGELTDIIAQYLQLAGVLAYNTVADMKTAENLVNGSITRTLGFNSVGDGGSALYKVREVTNEDTVNEMDIIALSDVSLVAELVSDKYNVMCYGVTADDDNNNNHTIIEYVVNKMKDAYLKVNITLKNTLHLGENNTNFEFNTITYTGNSVAINIEGFNLRLTGFLIASNYDGLRIGNTKLTSGNVITLNRISALHDSVIIGGSQGVLDSQLIINRLEYMNHGLYFDLSQKWVGQIGLYNTVFADTTDSSVTENYAIYMDCSSNGMTGLDLYNISVEGAKGGIYATTTGNVTSKFIEHLNVYGCRMAEFSLNNKYKFLKFITVASLNNIKVEGEIHFDTAYVTSFDVSDYYGSQGTLELHGVLRTENLTTLVGRGTIGLKGILGFRKILIDGSDKGYQNLAISDDTTVIVPRATNMILRAPDHTVGLKLATDEFNYIGEYNIYIFNNCTLQLLNNNGTVARTYNLTPSNLLIIRAVSTYGDRDVQIIGEVVSSVWAGTATG